MKRGSKRNKISLENILNFFHRHSSVLSSSFENSWDDGKWSLGAFNATCVESIFATGDKSCLSRFGFELIMKRNGLDFETNQNSLLWKIQNEIFTYFGFEHL